MPSNLELFLQGELDDRPLPDLVIEHLGGVMIHVDQNDGTRLYRVVDWVYEVTNSKSKQRNIPWANLKRTIGKQGDFEINDIITALEIDTAGGPQTTDFTDAEGLYAITQRMSDRSKTVRLVKGYLAKAGVFTDEVRRDPDVAMKAAIERYRHEGKSEEWIQMRIASKIARERFTSALRQAVSDRRQ